MNKRLLLLSLLLLMLFGAGCAGVAAPVGANQVHMATHIFLVSSITIKQGESVALVNDAGLSHIVLNGSWVDGQQVYCSLHVNMNLTIVVN
jgi:plastocyanin